MLLEYLVEETLAGRRSELKAYTIGTKVLGRPSRFDPQVDAIVRVEVGRLRATIDRYYRSHPASSMVFSIPKGQYGVEIEIPHRMVATGPDRFPPRVVLIPFADRGSDPADDFYADGITEELGRRLSHASDVLTITGNPVHALEPSGVPPSAVADQANARFVILGSVRAWQGRLRVHAELFDAKDGAIVWSDRIETDLAKLHPFEVEDWLVDRISGRLADRFGAINGILSSELADLDHDDEDVDSYVALLRYHHAYRSPNASAMTEAGEELELVLSHHPNHVRALAAMSDIVFTSWWLAFDQSLGGLERAEDLSQRAVAADPLSPDAQLATAFTHFARDRMSQFEMAIEESVRLDRHSPRVLCSAGVLYSLNGSFERGNELCNEAVDLNPFVPAWWRLSPCLASLSDGDEQEALFHATQIGGAGAFVGPLLRLALIGRLGIGDPKPEMKTLLEFIPEFDSNSSEYVQRVVKHEGTAEKILDGIHRAGVFATG